jgi:hypothetical protein
MSCFIQRFPSRPGQEYWKLFKIGYSWGGGTGLALAYPSLERPGMAASS